MTSNIQPVDLAKFNFDANTKREDLERLARAAETAERYEDMCVFMHELVKIDGNLTVEQRNMLSVAYKNVVGARRATWRTLMVEDYKDNEKIIAYKGMIEAGLGAVCDEILKLLNSTLIPAAKSKDNETQVFYLKMAGDYYRYYAEFSAGQGEQAKKCYEEAMVLAQDLLPTNPIRLGLALNYSVCMYEILKDETAACDLAKKAFDEAISKLDTLDEESYKDSTLIMQLLRDNLTLWSHTAKGEGAEEED